MDDPSKYLVAMNVAVAPLPPAAADSTAVPVSERDHVTSSPRSEHIFSGPGKPAKPYLLGVGRRTLGITLLLMTVILWTASQFLASVISMLTILCTLQLTRSLQTIFADNTYSKPYFVTYVNTSFFSISLFVILIRRLYASNGSISRTWRGGKESSNYTPITSEEDPADLILDEYDEDLRGGHPGRSYGLFGSQPPEYEALAPARPEGAEGALDVTETAKLSLEFCMLWV